MSNQALLLLFDGVEEIEAITPIDLLRRANIKLTTAAVGTSLTITGRSNITITADELLSNVFLPNFSTLIIPGGPGVLHLQNDTTIINLISSFNKKGHTIAAICAAPTLLHKAHILKNINFTCHSSVQKSITSGSFKPKDVILSDHIITSRGAGTAIAFSLSIIEHIINQEEARKVIHQIHYQDTVV